MSSFTADPDEVEQMLVSPGSQSDLGSKFFESFREFKADIDGREIVLTASHDGGPNMRVGGTMCHQGQTSGLDIGAEYHMAFRFDAETGAASILVRDITAGTAPHRIDCTERMERRPAGRSDTLVLGMGVTDAGLRSDMGFQGSVNHIMLYDSSISDAGANIFYGGASQMNNHNLAITYNGARLLKSEDNAITLETSESCLIEDHAQPFSFWRTARDCTDKEKEDRAGTACYTYYAGHLNDLAPRTKYELRSSVDEYVLVKALETERAFKWNEVGDPLSMDGRSFDTHLNIKVWGAGGGLAPEWQAKNPKRRDAMELGCSNTKIKNADGKCRLWGHTEWCADDQDGFDFGERFRGCSGCYTHGDHDECGGCFLCMTKVRFCARPTVALSGPWPNAPQLRN